MSSDAAESSRAALDGEAAARKRPWVVLSAFPRVVGDQGEEADKFSPGTDFEFELRDPPRPTVLLLPERLAADLDLSESYPSVVATHPSGRILLHASQAGRGGGVVKSVYFLCDAHARTVTRLPDCDTPLNLSTYGIIGLAGDARHEGQYIVAQLHRATASSSGPDALVHYSTATGAWGVKALDSSSLENRPWQAHGVFAHDGALWWVDAAYGVVRCDPFEDTPRLLLIPLPTGFDSTLRREFMDQKRVVGLSERELRFVEIVCPSCDTAVPLDALPDNTTVRMWTLVFDSLGRHQWRSEYKVRVADIWADAGYLADGLPPNSVPALALVHPHDHGVLYFSQGGFLFAADLGEKRLLGREGVQFDGASYIEGWKLSIEHADDDEKPLVHPDVGADSELASLLHRMEVEKVARQRNFKGYKIFMSSPNPLKRLHSAPQVQVTGVPTATPIRSRKHRMEDALVNLQGKIREEKNVRTLQKLMRERKHVKDLMEASPLDDHEDNED